MKLDLPCSLRQKGWHVVKYVIPPPRGTWMYYKRGIEGASENNS